MKDFIALIHGKCGIKQKPITTRNSQANAIVERAHQTIGDLLCTFEIDAAKLDPDNPWGGILSAVLFTLQSIAHMAHKATPIQLIFGRDNMLT
eukprot:14276268-Ditylum_brightwellii.AAC.1